MAFQRFIFDIQKYAIMLDYKNTVLFLLLISFIPGGQLYAQDAHYWTLQYGTKSTFLGGAVIGSVEDLGATYYNPAMLSLLPDPSFLLSTEIFESTKYTMEDGAGEGKNLTNSSLASAPGLVAGSFKLKFLKKHYFAYSFLTRGDYGIALDLQNGTTADVIESIPGDELLASELAVRQRLKEEWQGLTWSFPINDKFSVGLTNYLVMRDQQTDFRVILQAFTQNQESVLLNRVNEFRYQHIGLLWKFGLAYNLEQLSIGLNLTTPRVKLRGNGRRLYDSVLSGGAVDGDGGLEDFFAANLQKDLEAKYKSGWSAGLGVGYKIGKSRIHTSVEWFEGVDKFEILSPESFNRQDNGESLRFPIVQEFKQVINYGFGAEVAVNDDVSLFGSYFTDFSAAADSLGRVASFEGEANASVSNWDLNHISGGLTFNILKGKTSLTFGLTYSFANKDIPILINLPSGGDRDGPIFDRDKTTTLRFRRWRFIFGATYSFN